MIVSFFFKPYNIGNIPRTWPSDKTLDNYKKLCQFGFPPAFNGQKQAIFLRWSHLKFDDVSMLIPWKQPLIRICPNFFLKLTFPLDKLEHLCFYLNVITHHHSCFDNCFVMPSNERCSRIDRIFNSPKEICAKGWAITYIAVIRKFIQSAIFYRFFFVSRSDFCDEVLSTFYVRNIANF